VQPSGPSEAKAGDRSESQTAAFQSQACGQIIVVASRARTTADTITRSKCSRSRRRELLEQVKKGADFASSRARNPTPDQRGAARIMARSTSTSAEIHDAIKAAVRARVARSRRIRSKPSTHRDREALSVRRRMAAPLVRYKGAKKADGDVKRTKEQAKCLRKRACAAREGR